MLASDGRAPIFGYGAVIVFLGVALVAVGFALGRALDAILGASGTHGLRVALVFVGYDVAVGLLLIPAIFVRLRRDAAMAARGAGGEIWVEGEVGIEGGVGFGVGVSVLVAAYQEAGCIVDTVRRIGASIRRGSGREIMVGDDGSTDGTWALLVAAFGARAPKSGVDRFHGKLAAADGSSIALTVLRLPHLGKGATLNALAVAARYPVLVTLDADTWPEPFAIEKLAAAFADPRVASAAGVVMIKNGRDNWLLNHQAAEYMKNALVRIGWASLGALDQVPGAFSGLRKKQLLEAGGFPTDSLTEDYEVTFRLMRAGLRRASPPRVVCVSAARVWTEGPSTFRGFIRQRTRWFAGFLSTMFRYRDLIFEPRAGAFGVVRLPLKLIDAVLPLVAFASLFVLVHGGMSALRPVARASLFLFCVRWGWDLLVYALALVAARRLGDARETSSPRPLLGWLAAATEALTFVWLKHVATMRGFSWAIRRVRTWESSRLDLRAPSALRKADEALHQRDG